MALKQWVKKCQPLSLYIILTLTMFYFLLQLVVSYITHSLTLTIDSYLMLCNLIALFGCIITIKVCEDENNSESTSNSEQSVPGSEDEGSKSDVSDKSLRKSHECSDVKPTFQTDGGKTSEKRLKNTFGWARVDVLVMLIGSVTFASLCFSSVIDAVQTLFHISHQDEMHYPIPVFCVGAFGLVLNGLCYLLIGGYTFHHGSSLRITSDGVVVLDNALKTNGERKLNLRFPRNIRSSPGAHEMCRDVMGCVFVMIVAVIVQFTDKETAKIADPITSIISALFLIALSYPYMKESCFMLLQTIPNHMDIDSLHKQLTEKFPAILNVHDLHVWQFTKDEIFLTAHIVFISPQLYANVHKKITTYFQEQGVNKISIQPEFYKDDRFDDMISCDNHCLIKCVSPDCYQRYCCDQLDHEELDSIYIANVKNINSQNMASSSSEEACPVETKRSTLATRLDNTQTSETTSSDTKIINEVPSNVVRTNSGSSNRDIETTMQTEL